MHDFLEGLEGLDSIGSVSSVEAELAALLRKQKASLESVRNDISRKDQLVAHMQERIRELEDGQLIMQRVAQADKKKLQSELSESIATESRISTENADLSSQLAAATRKGEDMTVLADHLRDDLEARTIQLREAHQRIEVLEGFCENLQAEALDKQRQVELATDDYTQREEKHKEVEHYYEEIKLNQQKKLSELEAQCATCKRELHTAQETNEFLRDSASRLQSKFDSYVASAKDAEIKHSQEKEQLRIACIELSDDYDDARHRHDDMTAAVSEFGMHTQLASELYGPLSEHTAELLNSRYFSYEEKQLKSSAPVENHAIADKPKKSRKIARKVLTRKHHQGTPAIRGNAESKSESTPERGEESKSNARRGTALHLASDAEDSAVSDKEDATSHHQSPQELSRIRADVRAFIRRIQRDVESTAWDTDPHISTGGAIPQALSFLLRVLNDNLDISDHVASVHRQIDLAAKALAVAMQEQQAQNQSNTRSKRDLMRHKYIEDALSESIDAELKAAGLPLVVQHPVELPPQAQAGKTSESARTKKKTHEHTKNAQKNLMQRLSMLADVEISDVDLEQEEVRPPVPPTREELDRCRQEKYQIELQYFCRQIGHCLQIIQDLTEENKRMSELHSCTLLASDEQLETHKRELKVAFERGRRQADDEHQPILDQCNIELQRLKQSYENAQLEVVDMEHKQQLALESAERHYESQKLALEAEVSHQIDELATQVAAIEVERDQHELQLKILRQHCDAMVNRSLELYGRLTDTVAHKRLYSRFSANLDALSHDVGFLSHCCVGKSAERGSPGVTQEYDGTEGVSSRFQALEFSPAIMHRLHRLSRSGGYLDNIYAHPTVAQASRRSGTPGARSYILPSLRSIVLAIIASNRFKKILSWTRHVRGKGARPSYGSYFSKKNMNTVTSSKTEDLVDRVLSLTTSFHENVSAWEAGNLVNTICLHSSGGDSRSTPRKADTISSLGLTRLTSSTPSHRPLHSELPTLHLSSESLVSLRSSGAHRAVNVLERALIFMSAQLSGLRQEQEAAANERLSVYEDRKFFMGSKQSSYEASDVDASLADLEAILNSPVETKAHSPLNVTEGESTHGYSTEVSSSRETAGFGGEHASTYVNVHMSSNQSSVSKSLRTIGTSVIASPSDTLADRSHYMNVSGLNDAPFSPAINDSHLSTEPFITGNALLVSNTAVQEQPEESLRLYREAARRHELERIRERLQAPFDKKDRGS